MEVRSPTGEQLHHFWLRQDVPLVEHALQQDCNMRRHLQAAHHVKVTDTVTSTSQGHPLDPALAPGHERMISAASWSCTVSPSAPQFSVGAYLGRPLAAFHDAISTN